MSLDGSLTWDFMKTRKWLVETATAAVAKPLQSCLTPVQPTRLPQPWDSPGKNTGVGCHFLLQCMKVKSESEVSQSCLTLSDPMDCSLPGSSVHAIFQTRVIETTLWFWGIFLFVFVLLCKFFILIFFCIFKASYLLLEYNQLTML